MATGAMPQDTATFAKSLPRLLSELDVVVVRMEGSLEFERQWFNVHWCG